MFIIKQPLTKYLPVVVDVTSGNLKVNSTYEEVKNETPFTFQVTVMNAVESLNISDEAVVTILINERYSDQKTETGSAVFERAFINPPTNIDVKFYRKYPTDNPNYCLYDEWFIDMVMILPPGNHNLLINLFGPSFNKLYYGYIEYLFVYYNGTNIMNNYSIQFSNFIYLGNNSMPAVYTMLAQFSVSSFPSNNTEDFSIKMRFKVGLSREKPILPTVTPKITMEISMIVTTTCPIQSDLITFVNCPAVVYIGGVYEYTMDYFISRPFGDYIFTFSTDEYSASIGHISLTLPPTFSAFPEDYKINTEQLVTSKFIMTTIGYVNVTNLQNFGVYDKTLPASNRSVRLTAFVIIFRTTLPSIKFEAKMSLAGTSSTVNYCETTVDTYTAHVMAGNNFMTITETPMKYEPEKVQFLTVQVTVTPFTQGVYAFRISNQGKLIAEPSFVDYLITANNTIKKVRLITEYTLSSGMIKGSNTVIGVFTNFNSRSVTYNFRIGIKLCYSKTYVQGDVAQIQLIFYTSLKTLNTTSITLPNTSMANPPSTTPSAKSAILIVEKIEPRNSPPMRFS
ncbi:unnamed protein product [Schistosoma turkestanicum]|nr:unnamed protein product [Schistosoma turkestanicum]